MIDFDNIADWRVGNEDIVEAKLNGVTVWKRVPLFTGENPQAPDYMGPYPPAANMKTYLPETQTIDISGYSKIKVTIKRIANTRDYTSGGTHYFESGTVRFYLGLSKKTLSMPTNIGDKNTYIYSIPSGTTNGYFEFEASGHGTTAYGYIGSNVFELTVTGIN